MPANGRDAPGRRLITPLPVLREMRTDPLGYLERQFQTYGDVTATRLGPFWAYTIFHPDDVKRVLQDNNQNYVKGPIIAKAKVLIGEGLFTSEGDFWRRQRRLAQPAFHRQRIAGFAAVMRDTTAAMLDEWAARSGTGVPFDVSAEMSRLTLRIVGRALFGIDLAGEAEAVGRALLQALEYINDRTMSFPAVPWLLPTPRNVRFWRARAELDRVVYGIIEHRRRSSEDRGDFLSMLLQVRDEETGEGMSDRQLRDEVMTFVLAGHETTAMALSWTWYLLARHPEVEAHLRTEVRAVLGERAPAAEDVPGLAYTRMVVEETMRLYPPLWGFGRQAIGPDTLGGYPIRARATVNIVPYVTHRHPAFWEDPERFDPERFTPERSAGRPRFAYLPFSGGPRLCIGNEFALMEAQLIVAMVAQRYRLVLKPGTTVAPEVRTTLRPRGGVPMTVETA